MIKYGDRWHRVWCKTTIHRPTRTPQQFQKITKDFSNFRLLFQIKQLKELEKEKDALWSGLEILEKTRIWYLQQLKENKAQQNNIKIKSGFGSCQEGVVEVGALLDLGVSWLHCIIHLFWNAVALWHSHSMMLPPPCLTVRMVLSD